MLTKECREKVVDESGDVASECASLDDAIKQKTVTKALLKGVVQKLKLPTGSCSKEDASWLLKMVDLIRCSADMIGAGETQDWSLDHRIKTQKPQSNKRRRVVEKASDSAIGWDFKLRADYPEPPPIVEDYVDPVAPATQMREILLWLEDWRSNKSLTMANPLSYEELYDLQCDTQTKVASATEENARKLRVALEEHAENRGQGETLDFPLGLLHVVHRMCGVLTYAPEQPLLAMRQANTRASCQVPTNDQVGDSDLAATNASPTDAIQATTEVSRTAPREIRVDGMSEWLESLNGSGS